MSRTRRIDHAQIIHDYLGNNTVEEIANRNKCEYNTVLTIIESARKAGATIPGKRPGRTSEEARGTKHHPPSLIRAVVSRYNDNETAVSIARSVGITYKAVLGIIDRQRRAGTSIPPHPVGPRTQGANQ